MSIPCHSLKYRHLSYSVVDIVPAPVYITLETVKEVGTVAKKKPYIFDDVVERDKRYKDPVRGMIAKDFGTHKKKGKGKK
jgi:hypothetical protein